MLLLYLHALITLAHLHVIMALFRLDGDFNRRLRSGLGLHIVHLLALFTFAHVHVCMAIVGLGLSVTTLGSGGMVR